MTVCSRHSRVAQTSDEETLRHALRRFLSAKLAVNDLEVVALRRHVEGFSWETYEIGARWTERHTKFERGFIVHRVPEAGLLEPYSAGRVFDLRQAVEKIKGVPVPRSLWLDECGYATGRPLYVVERVDGEVPTQWTSDTFFKDDEERRSTARQLMSIGAALHAASVRIAPEGLRGSGPDAFEIIRCWYDIYRRDCGDPVPALDWGFAWLFANRARISERRAVLHGDFRTGNYMVRDGEIVALLDFEESHVGDPVQDLAHCALRLFRGRTRQPSGLVSLPEMLEFYEEAAGWAVPHAAFHFWSVFEAVYTAVTQHRAASLFARERTNDVRYSALGYQAHHVHRHVIDYVEAAERGGLPQ